MPCIGVSNVLKQAGFAYIGDSAAASELVVASSSEPSTSGKYRDGEKRCVFCWRGEKSSLGQGKLVKCEPTPGFNPLRKQLKTRQNSSEAESGKRRARPRSVCIPL